MPEPSDGHGARVVGRYILFGEIAAGGMATVHFGRLNGPVGFSRTVAIKRLHPQFAKDPEFVTMFLDEARLAGRIRHPNVVPTLDVVATEGEIFLVMEYVQGESLARLTRALRARSTTVPPEVAVSILAGALHGLHAAHEAKDEHGQPLDIVHRDVSPQNILIGTDGVARVLDFGVAKAAGRLQTTREGQIKGKIAYMAPEQLHSGHVTRQTDVYAAAVVLWETLTGRRLFEGDNEAMVLMKAIQGHVPPASSLVPSLPPSFDAVIARGLARAPAERWPTARDMAIALERCGRMASPSEVGEWVERVAADELLKRAARVAEIESVTSQQGSKHAEALIAEATRSAPRVEERSSVSSQVTSAVVAIPVSRSAPRGQDPDSQLSSISVSRSGQPSRRGGSKKGMAALLVLGAVGVLSGAVLVGRRSVTPAAPPPVSQAAPSPPAIDLPPVVADIPPVAANDTPALPPAKSPSPTTAGTTPAPRPLVRPPPRPPPPSPKSSCDPPYTIDAAGHKKYKLECVSK